MLARSDGVDHGCFVDKLKVLRDVVATPVKGVLERGPFQVQHLVGLHGTVACM